MGNAGGREEKEDGGPSAGSDGEQGFIVGSDHIVSIQSVDPVVPPPPPRSLSPLMFSPQVPLAPIQSTAEVPTVFNQLGMNRYSGPLDVPLGDGIPTLITWNYGGNKVAVEGSWDNWTSRKPLWRSGKDHVILLVLPSGVYQYKFIVDGEWRYISDLPSVTDEKGNITNLLDVQDYVPENTQSISKFEPPPSPDSSYSQEFPIGEDFSKEPPSIPPQLGMRNPDDLSLRPHHSVLDHLFLERGWGPQSLAALSLTHRFKSKYVTVVLYKPTRK